MSAQPDLTTLSVGQFADRFRTETLQLGTTFPSFGHQVPLSEDELNDDPKSPTAPLPPH